VPFTTAEQVPDGVPHVLPVQVAVAEPLVLAAVLAVEALVVAESICENDAEQPVPQLSVAVAHARFAVQEAFVPVPAPLHVHV
jgi:hypothetical protein